MMQAKASLMNRKKKILHITIIAVYIFIANIFVKYFVPDIVTKMLPLTAIILLISISGVKSFKIHQNIIGYFIFGCLYLFCAIYSAAPVKGLLYSLSYLVSFFFISTAMKFEILWNRIFIVISVICTVFVTAILIQSINPGLVRSITKFFPYTSEERYLIEAWARNKWYSGFFPDRAPAAFFSSILCGTGIYFLFKKRKEDILNSRLFGIVFFIYGIWGVLLTAKRGILFAALIAALVCYLINRRASGKPIWAILFVIMISTIIAIFIIEMSNVADVMIDRIFNSDDFYTNRLNIYEHIIENIRKSFFIGNGTASADSLLGIGGHNIYLTVLMENGIMGFLIFISVWIIELVRSAKNIFIAANTNNEYISIITFSTFIQIFFIVYGMSGNPLYDNYILNFYFLGVLMNENITYKMRAEKDSNIDIPIS